MSRKFDRKGVIIVLVTFLLIGILLFIGFSVDLARIMRVRTELRVIADLSAKAAAGELSRTQDLDLAKEAAQEVALHNQVAAKNLTLANKDIIFGHSSRQLDGTWSFQANENPLNSVRVNAKRITGSVDGPIRLFFGGLYSRPNFETQASATATFLDVDICLVLDRSSSMKLSTLSTSGGMSTSDPRFCRAPRADSRWVALDDAIDLFVDRLTMTLATEYVSVVTFASNYTSKCRKSNLAATVDLNLTNTLPRVNAAMTVRSNTVWNGATDITAGIDLGHTVLMGPSSRTYATKIMILLTDGVYTGEDPVSSASWASDDNIFIHTITFGSGANQIDMQAVARAGNGDHYHAPDAKALEDVFTQITGSIAILTE